MRNELKVWAKSVKDKRNKWMDKNRENLLAHSTKEESILYNNLLKCIKDKCIRQKSITIGLAIRRGLLLIELHWQTQGRMWRGIKYPLIRRRGN